MKKIPGNFAEEKNLWPRIHLLFKHIVSLIRQLAMTISVWLRASWTS